MIYEYRCKHGHGTFDVYKPACRSPFPERCPQCRSQMIRVYANGSPSVGMFQEGYYHAFGKEIRTKNQLNAAMKEHKLKTGNEVIEIGNEQIKRQPRKQYNKEAAMRELRGRWHS